MPVFALVRYGNWLYFLWIFFLLAITALSVYLCHRFGKKFAYRYISVILWANFALHFLKQLLPNFYNRWPTSLSDSFFPNLCAVLIVISPFIFHWGNKYFKDYMYYLGVISGVLVYFVPTGAMKEGLSQGEYLVEMFRFYMCHWPLVVGGLLMVEQGFHRLDWKRLWAVPVIFCGILALISVHEIVSGPILKLEGTPHDWVGEHGLLNRACAEAEYSNQSMQFGPQKGVDSLLGWAYPYLIPGLMTFRVEGVIYFTPVIWIFPFIALATLIVGPLMAAPFEKRQMRMDLLVWRQKRKMKRLQSQRTR